MKKIQTLNKILVVGIFIILISVGTVPSLKGIGDKGVVSTEKTSSSADATRITCYSFGIPGSQSHKETYISLDQAQKLIEKITTLERENALHPSSEKTVQLRQDILQFADENNLLPKGISKVSLNQNNIFSSHSNKNFPSPSSSGTASERLCTFVSAGSGTSLPIIILPRLIPILLTPIPRIFVRWNTENGLTSCGGLRSGTGFIAFGQQKGIALGFWGIGFTFSLPPFMGMYGMIGYALYASVTGDDIEFYPPNNPPEISAEYPTDGMQNVPLSITELRFHIEDYDSDLMNYSVTTTPDIGSGTGTYKADGTYTIPIHGIQSSTEYTWHISVDDGKDTVERDYSFTTVIEAPVVSDPHPRDNQQFVPITTSNLSFTITDYQEDPISWTVETSPDIGSGSGTHVNNGQYSVPISGLQYFTQYTWFVNATDGEFWMRRTFSFTTTSEGILGIEPSDDTTIHHNAPDTNDGDEPTLTVRNEEGASSGWERDVLIHFDLSALPSNASIQYASLQLFYSDWRDNNPSGRALNLYRAITPWNEETVTWNTQPAYANQPTTFASVPAAPGVWMSWDITTDIQAFSNGSLSNHGWKITDENYWGSPDIPIVYYLSKENTDNVPLLIIGYEE